MERLLFKWVVLAGVLAVMAWGISVYEQLHRFELVVLPENAAAYRMDRKNGYIRMYIGIKKLESGDIYEQTSPAP